ncbi:hypothetical protein EJ08DRAFT_699214 [Tothia fuscella]|uniref:N-acetyltransferase domain-containing protein n=1 Tax=Tothia fuscella TaxID=1048955 RepID=A0A9P4NN67_9PEZI|nr:hypothetical protein EJ08DRAFT_699214 [Tothia fuscella]
MVRSAQSATSNRLEPHSSAATAHQTAWKRGHGRGGSVGEKIQIIPGFKTGSAFLTSLGANLRIADDDLLPSPTYTPVLRATPGFHHFLPHQSPLATAIMPLDDMDCDSSEHGSETPRNDPFEGVPPLSTTLATEEKDIVAALKLVADSVAQQRQTASRILIFHPLNMAIFTAVLALMVQFLYKSKSDIALLLTTGAGVTMAALVAVKWFTGDYLLFAEDINWAWLGDDQVYITKYGDEVIGSCVVGWEKGEGRGNRRKKWGRGIVRAWTVRLRYRGKAVGSALLEEAAKGVEKKGGDGLVFAEDHANSRRVLKSIYNSHFDKKEKKYRDALQAITARTGDLCKKR